jgi:hypothetical protein
LWLELYAKSFFGQETPGENVVDTFLCTCGGSNPNCFKCDGTGTISTPAKSPLEPRQKLATLAKGYHNSAANPFEHQKQSGSHRKSFSQITPSSAPKRQSEFHLPTIIAQSNQSPSNLDLIELEIQVMLTATKSQDGLLKIVEKSENIDKLNQEALTLENLRIEDQFLIFLRKHLDNDQISRDELKIGLKNQADRMIAKISFELHQKFSDDSFGASLAEILIDSVARLTITAKPNRQGLRELVFGGVSLHKITINHDKVYCNEASPQDEPVFTGTSPNTNTSPNRPYFKSNSREALMANVTPKKTLLDLLSNTIRIQKNFAHEQVGARNDRRNEIKKLINKLATEMEVKNGN